MAFATPEDDIQHIATMTRDGISSKGASDLHLLSSASQAPDYSAFGAPGPNDATGSSSVRRRHHDSGPYSDDQASDIFSSRGHEELYSDDYDTSSSEADSLSRWQRDSRRHDPQAGAKTETEVTNPARQALVPTKVKDVLYDELLERLNRLEKENVSMKTKLGEASTNTQEPQGPGVLAYRYQIIHRLGRNRYLDEPGWQPGEKDPVLIAGNAIRNLDYYQDQHPEIAFTVQKTYDERVSKDLSKIQTKDGVFRRPEPFHQELRLIAPAMREAVELYIRQVPSFRLLFPEFSTKDPILAPYLFIYYSENEFDAILGKMDQSSAKLMSLLRDYVLASHGDEYAVSKSQLAKGNVSAKLVKYLIKPKDVLVNNKGPSSRAYQVLDWPREEAEPETVYMDSLFHDSRAKQESHLRKTKKMLKYAWHVPVWSWHYNGVFQRRLESLVILMRVSYEDELISVKELSYFPLKYAAKDFDLVLENRGNTFWKIRTPRYVTYESPDVEDDVMMDDRWMVDAATYKRLFPESEFSKIRLTSDFTASEFASDIPPGGIDLLLFPPFAVGYNMLRKRWAQLYVDHIKDVEWNKQAFRDLVAGEDTKELVQALVMKQLAARKSTDWIQGKGNGLIMLLHGAPGTGKTFTAEGVAEFAEKPLLRVTCGDIGVQADIVEKKLQGTFELGKIWDCVVLLDEADVFLEERDMKDLNRNALVSVFLRELEYYNGILILTSNRVGTFDEAFKSRLQLALHYENFSPSQRKKIWRNFMNRLKTLDEENMDYDDVIDHLDELAREDMNGREIRNAITTARQLAQFKGKSFDYSHLSHVIKVASKFGKYLKDLRNGLTEDDLKRDSEIRLTYQKPRRASE